MRTSLRFALSPHTWLVPMVIILGLAVLFPAVYLVATVDPQDHLENMPVALVVESQTTDQIDLARTVADAIRDHDTEGRLALQTVTAEELDRRMANDEVAGAIVIPATFNADLKTLLPGSEEDATPPTINVRTNAGDGGISTGLLTGNVTPLLTGIDEQVGQQLLGSARSSGAPLSPAQERLLAAPFEVHTEPYAPLPEKAGLGTSAFYYALILVLLGFVGASTVSPTVDSVLGFFPSELGPLVARRPYIAITRRQTLLIKLGIMITASPVAALIVEVVAGLVVGVPISSPLQLWALSTTAIAAIGVSVMSVFAIFGSGIGSIANTLFFIALSMTASGGTVPVTALPPFFRFLATFEPFRPVLQGVRAIFYFDAEPAAGLTAAWIHIGIGLVIGVLLGLVVTTLYARKQMFTRHPRPAPAPSS